MKKVIMEPEPNPLTAICQAIDPYQPTDVAHLLHQPTGRHFHIRTLDAAHDLDKLIDWLGPDSPPIRQRPGSDYLDSYLMVAQQPDMQAFMVLVDQEPALQLDVRQEPLLFQHISNRTDNHLLTLNLSPLVTMDVINDALQAAVYALFRIQAVDTLFLELDGNQAFLGGWVREAGFSLIAVNEETVIPVRYYQFPQLPGFLRLRQLFA
ncbi:hypothetical protein HB364_13630 [Pseudoflavitalea sp. X16]|uniref:hypothetical protein n=1 Tax=Paraflavitalea devenefica TaxID=2716334 RepID=UPI00141DCA3E|nr:hypothetical protein [Paraflavitalea devenefica]NII26129.1 hypothetical protein [Paraflavitalea devenefica]